MNEDLRKHFARLTQFLETSAFGMHRVASDGTILWANSAELSLLGYTSEEYIGQPIARFHADPAVIQDILTRLANGERLKDYASRLVCKDGSLRDVLIDSCVLWEDGHFVHTQCFTRDVTAQKVAETAMRTSERQLRLIIDHVPILVAHLDRGHRFKFVNRTYAERFGRKPEELVGLHLSEIVGAPAYAILGPKLEEAGRGRPVQFEQEVPYATLGPRWVQIVYTPEMSEQGEVLGIMTVITDFTDRKKEERELAVGRDSALAASSAKDDFLAALSHELRTPLNPALLIASEAAEDMALSEEIRHDFSAIRKNIELEARLIDDLLDLTRITRGKLSLDKRTIDAHLVLQDAIAIIRSDAIEKGVGVSARLEATHVAVEADPVRLQQIFWNVLKNAVKFTPAGGQVVIATANPANGGQVAITISDTGMGMTPAELKRAFEAFAQGDHAVAGGSHRYGGLGLGLAITRLLVEMHSGAIRAGSPGPGAGSTFTVEFPIVGELPPVKPERKTPERRASENPVEPAAAGRRRILLLEDHTATREVLARLLRQRKYDVLTAGSIAEARIQAEVGDIDLLMFDIGLPDGSGLDFLVAMRARFGTKGIAMTGYGMEADVARSEQAGSLVHLTKPVQVSQLDKALATFDGLARD